MAEIVIKSTIENPETSTEEPEIHLRQQTMRMTQPHSHANKETGSEKDKKKCRFNSCIVIVAIAAVLVLFF